MPLPEESDQAIEKPKRKKRRRWSWSFRIRLGLSVILLLGLIGWRYGWPPDTRVASVTPLETITWLEAAELAPGCINPGLMTSSFVREVDGTLDESGRAVFDVDLPGIANPVVVSTCKDYLPRLELPDLTGKRFKAGIFFFDMPTEHEGVAADSLDPADAYTVLLMCPESELWEDAAEMVIDRNRNLDLTDDPVMELSEEWSHGGQNGPRHHQTRVFSVVTLRRCAKEKSPPDGLPETVDALPAIQVNYSEGEEVPDRFYVGFCPASFRKARFSTDGATHSVVIESDKIRFGRYDGPGEIWCLERGVFWGRTLDAEGTEMRRGPYDGPVGNLTAETFAGQTLRIGRFDLKRSNSHPFRLVSSGWVPVPKFPRFTLPVKQQKLPVGDYGFELIRLYHGLTCQLTLRAPGSSTRQFSIQDGETSKLRLPKTLTLEPWAYTKSDPNSFDWDVTWDSSDACKEEAGEMWKVPSPGDEVLLQLGLSDPATGVGYAIEHLVSPDKAYLAIKDASGNVVLQTDLEYG